MMNPPASSSSFNAVAGALIAQDRKALIDSIRSTGVGQVSGGAAMISVTADQPGQGSERLFYVGFPGAKRDGIPTQHYLVPASDEREAVTRAHQLYELQPRRRKGASLQVMLGKPPTG